MMAFVGQPEIVNPVPIEEIAGWTKPMSTAFLGDPDSQRTADMSAAIRRTWEPSRAWGARDLGRWVATLRTEGRQLTVPAGSAEVTTDLEVDAVTNVTVAATHRRRGLMRRMLLDSLTQARERGDAASALISAEWPIYGRFGYAPATLAADYTLHAGRRGSAPPGDPSRVRQVEIEEFAQHAPEVFAAARRLRAGQMDRAGDWWTRALGLDGYPRPEHLPHNWLIHEGDQGPDGLLAWRAEGHMSLVRPRASVEVWGLVSASWDAYRDLWAYLAGIDAIDEVKLSNRPVDEPVRWLLGDGRTLALTQAFDFLWLRLLDVPAVLRARRYAAAGELVLQVIDEPEADFASGRYLLAAGGDQVECEATDRPADVEIRQHTLASIYLGGFRLAQLAPAGAVRELTPGACERLDLMFSTPLPPWNATWF